MHLDKQANQPPQLVIEDVGEVLLANEALRLAGCQLEAGRSVMSSPITMGGEFPKRLSPADSALVLGIMEQVTESVTGAAELALSEPQNTPFLSIARLAVRGRSSVLDQGK
jgi:hypothetical protein